MLTEFTIRHVIATSFTFLYPDDSVSVSDVLYLDLFSPPASDVLYPDECLHHPCLIFFVPRRVLAPPVPAARIGMRRRQQQTNMHLSVVLARGH